MLGVPPAPKKPFYLNTFRAVQKESPFFFLNEVLLPGTQSHFLVASQGAERKLQGCELQ